MARLCPVFFASIFAVTTFTGARAQTASVQVPVWLGTNQCGQAPKFHANINGKPVPVVSELGPSSDQIILLVSDLTSSLSLIEPAKQALISQISKLPPNTWVALLRAQDGLHVLTNPEPNRKAAIAAIQALTNSGQPGLLGTVTPALSLAGAMSRKAPVRVSVLYITDGSIYSYREDYTNPVINQSDPYDLSRAFPDALIDDKISMLMDNVSSIEAPLFVVQLEFRGDQLSVAYQNGLKALARATGGHNLICQSNGQIPDTIAQMFHRILNTWLLTLALPPKIHDDANIQLRAPCRAAGPSLFWRTHIHLTGGLG